jgi:hypothetical protein
MVKSSCGLPVIEFQQTAKALAGANFARQLANRRWLPD